MSFPDSLNTLARTIEDNLVAVLDAYNTGQIDRETFMGSAAAILTQGRAGAITIADLALATELTRLWSRPVLPLGLHFTEADVNSFEAVRESMDSDRFQANSAAEMGTLARAAIFSAAQHATRIGLQDHKVKFWTRETNDKACPVCTGLADGTELSVDTRMYTHKGCNCTQRPTE